MDALSPVTSIHRLEPEHEEAPAARPAPAAAINTVVAHPSAHVTDHGGRILTHVDVAPVYLGDYWKTAAGTADRKFNDGALANLVKNKGITGIWKQYGAGKGTTHKSVALGGGSPSQLSQKQLDGLIRQQIAEGHFDTSNHQRVFTFVLPPGCELVSSEGQSSQHGLGGFHGSVNVNGREIYYAALAYPQRGNGIAFAGNARDDLTISESHEITEAVTDPDVELAGRLRDASKLGWYDDTTRWRGGMGKGEIGDIPVFDAELAGDLKLRSAWGRTEGYAFQKEWSERDHVSELAPKKR